MSASTVRKPPQHISVRLRLMALATAVLLLVSACIGSSSDDSDAGEASDVFTQALSGDASFDMADDDMADDMAMAEEEVELTQASVRRASGDAETADSDESGSEEMSSGVPTAPADLGRDIIYTAWIEVEAVDVAAAAAQATQTIESLGGFTFGQQTSTRGRVYTTLTFKIRPAQFPVALERLSGLGELVDQTVSAEDVTGIVVDLNSRISTAEISVDRLREFLSNATDAEGVAELERELAQRETNLERLRGQLRTLRDQVDLATITLTITESTEAVPTTSVVMRAWLAAGENDPCLESTELVAEPESDVGFCFELENNGETTLTEISLSSDALRFAMDELVVPVDMNLERLDPGDRVIATLTEEITDGRIAGRVATRGLDIDVRLRALPVADDGTELARLARTVGLHLYVTEDDSPPSFSDAVSGGWDALVGIGNGVLLIFGALLPFLPVIALALVVAWWWLRRRRNRRRVTATSSDD